MAKPKPPKRTEGEKVAFYQLLLRITSSVEKIIVNAAWSAAIAIFAYYGLYRTVQVAAGKETNVNLGYNFQADIGNNWMQVLPWILVVAIAAFCVIGYWNRMKERQSKDKRITKYEKILDPDRSSSNLTVNGEQTTDGSEL